MLVLLLLGQLLAQLQKAVVVLTQEQCFIKQAPYYCDNIAFWNVSSQKMLDSWHWEESWSWSKCNSFPDTPLLYSFEAVTLVCHVCPYYKTGWFRGQQSRHHAS